MEELHSKKSVQANGDVSAGRDISVMLDRRNSISRKEYCLSNMGLIKSAMRVQALQVALLILLVIISVTHFMDMRSMQNDIHEIKSMLFHGLSLGRRPE